MFSTMSYNDCERESRGMSCLSYLAHVVQITVSYNGHLNCKSVEMPHRPLIDCLRLGQ